jgi:hypothetical protein
MSTLKYDIYHSIAIERSYLEQYFIYEGGVHLAWAGFELTTLFVTCTDYTGSYKSNYHTFTTKTAPYVIGVEYFHHYIT